MSKKVAAQKRATSSAAQKTKYTAAQNASFNAWKKAHPFPKQTLAQFDAWAKAHPQKGKPPWVPYAQWVKQHPFKNTPFPKPGTDWPGTAPRGQAKVAAKAKAAKSRSLSPGDVGCCSAEAVAAYLRLAGIPVSDTRMLEMFECAGGHPDRGIPLEDMLAASGLPFTQADPDAPGILILGIDLPGPHAVLATPDGWWSWGELHSPDEFPDAVIEEAWALA
jgi:hypothetical protein